MATTYSSGVVTAYGAALEGGFTGTYQEFCTLMATLPTEYGNIEGSIAQPYSSSNTYPNIGTYVWHNGILYKNIVPITTAEEWTAAHWTTAEIGRDLINLENIVSTTTGNLLPDYNADSWTSPTSVSITRDGYALIINGTKENAGAVTITDQFVLGAGSYEFGVCDEDSLAGTGAYIQLFADGDVMSQTQTHTSVIVAAEKNVSFRILLNAGAEFNNLAIKPMLFAGSIPNTYIPQVSACDYVVRNNVAQITTELNEKANIDGSYSSLTAGNAEQLVSTVGVNNKTPYLFRTTGGSADVGDRVKLSEITGGTVAWNQLVNTGDTSVTVPNGHKYYSRINSVQTIGASTGAAISINDASEDNVFDLTAMFCSTIADYLYTLESGTAGAGVAKLKSWGFCTAPYYAYNAGTLLSVKTSAHKMVGFNQFDADNATVYYAYLANTATGVYNWVQISDSRSLAVRCLPNTTYCVYMKGDAPTLMRVGAITSGSLPSTPTSGGWSVGLENAFINVVSGQNKVIYTTGKNATYLIVQLGQSLVPTRLSDLCINLHWDGERDGEYEPYEVNTYPLDDVELRGIPKLDASNNLYYDGDSYAPDGTVTRKYATRAYEVGDATDGSTMITDGTDTVYKLTTPTAESAEPYQETQICNDFGTEEFVDSRTVPMPVGANALYQANLRAKLEMAPDSPDGDGDYIVRQTDGENTYVPLVIPTELPSNPSEDGTYSLKVTISSGTATLSWVADV